MTSTGNRSSQLRAAVRHARERSPASVVSYLTRSTQELQRLEPFDRAMTLAAQAFTSIFPLVIAIMSVLNRPDARKLGKELGEWLALPSDSRSALVEVQSQSTGQAASIGALSLLIVLLSATSFSRALTRMYAKAWSVTPPSWSAGWRWVVAVLGITTCTVVLQTMQRRADGEVTVAGVLLATLVANALLWTWVPSVLLAGQVTFRQLAPGGLFMGVASIPLVIASKGYMPRALSHAEHTYGDLGVAFTFIGWLFGVAFVLIVTVVLGAALSPRSDEGRQHPLIRDR